MSSLDLFNQFVSPAEQLVEAWGDVVSYDPVADGFGNTAYGSGRLVRPATGLYDRSDGKFLPVYQTEYELAVIRAMSRFLSVIAPGLVGGIRNMSNYTIGKGFTYTASRKPTADHDEVTLAPITKRVQREIDALLEDIDFAAGLEREVFTQSITDGETLLHLKPTSDGRVRVCRREPDELRQPYDTRHLEQWIEDAYGIPCSERVSSWSFGVHTWANETGQPLGYHFVTDETGADWEYAPACRVVHIKRNVTRGAKRGFSDLYPLEADTWRSEKLRRNMAEGAAIQAAIAYVKQFVEGVSRQNAEAILNANSNKTTQVQTQNGVRTNKTVQHPAGTVIAANGWTYAPGPMGSERAADFMVVAGYVQRMQAVRWAMPEYMFTGDASNANMASTFAATDPFVKSCEFEQGELGRHGVSMLWKALRIRFELGAFDDLGVTFDQIQQCIKIGYECPEVATRDDLKNVQRDQILVSLGVMARKTLASRNDLDYEEEVANGAAPDGQASGQSDPNAPVQSPGAFVGTKRSDFTNNYKATNDILKAFAAGTLSEVIAKAQLARLGWPEDQSQSMLDDARDGRVDNPLPEEVQMRNPYGNCPKCGAPGVQRERRPNGNDKCEKGCVYPSASAVMEQVTTIPTALQIIEELETYP